MCCCSGEGVVGHGALQQHEWVGGRGGALDRDAAALPGTRAGRPSGQGAHSAYFGRRPHPGEGAAVRTTARPISRRPPHHIPHIIRLLPLGYATSALILYVHYHYY